MKFHSVFHALFIICISDEFMHMNMNIMQYNVNIFQNHLTFLHIGV